jgi:dipeptidyl aminopeptidase/acylaminoacyl peptidase
MNYTRRLAAASLLLALATALVVLLGGGPRDVPVVARAPQGEGVSAGASISVTFGRPVDRASAQESLEVDPPVSGSFSWQGAQMTFRPAQPLLPNQEYEVTLRPGLADARGARNNDGLSWSFRTRLPRLLLVGDDSLTLVGADGSNARELAREPAGIDGVAVSPDGTQLLYGAVRDEGRTALLLLGIEDGSSKPLIEAPDVSAGQAAWSPNGDLIAFERRALVNGAIGPPHLWLARPDGTALGPLFSGQDISFAAAWAPDGAMLAYTDGLSQTLNLFTFTDERTAFADSTGEPASWAPYEPALVYSAFGSDAPSPKPLLRLVQLGAPDAPKPLTAGELGETSPAWSPNGSWIVFVQRGADGVSSTIAIVQPDGSGLTQLTQSNAASDLSPAWSPDSKLIAFVRQGAPGAQGEAWVAPVDGSAPHRVGVGVSRALWVP